MAKRIRPLVLKDDVTKEEAFRLTFGKPDLYTNEDKVVCIHYPNGNIDELSYKDLQRLNRWLNNVCINVEENW